MDYRVILYWYYTDKMENRMETTFYLGFRVKDWSPAAVTTPFMHVQKPLYSLDPNKDHCLTS